MCASIASICTLLQLHIQENNKRCSTLDTIKCTLLNHSWIHCRCCLSSSASASKSLATSSSPTVEHLRMSDNIAWGCGAKGLLYFLIPWLWWVPQLRSSSHPNSIPMVSHLWNILGANCGRTSFTAIRSSMYKSTAMASIPSGRSRQSLASFAHFGAWRCYCSVSWCLSLSQICGRA